MRAPRKSSSRPEPKPAARPEPDQAQAAGLPDEVFEFVAAIDEYKRQNQRPFPSWSEVLQVLKALGYRKTG
jgi:hypothetical protein